MYFDLNVESRSVGEEEPGRVLVELMRGLFVGEPRDDVFGVYGAITMAEKLTAGLGIGR